MNSETVMTTDEAKDHLQQMLLDAGFDLDHPGPVLAWQVFKQFAVLPIESGGGRECEGIWFEAGNGNPDRDWPGYFDFVRMFLQGDDDEPGWYEQLTAHFTCNPAVKLVSGEGIVLHADLVELNAWFREVESSEAFKVGLPLTDWSFEVRID